MTLKDVSHAPYSKFSLSSVTKRMKDRWTVKGSKGHLDVEKEDVKIFFDTIIKTQRGPLFSVNIQRNTEWSNAAFDLSKDVAHALLRHSNLEATLLSARKLVWNLIGTMHKCNRCCVSKAKQKAVPKLSKYFPDNEHGTRFFLCLSKIMKLLELKSMGKINWFFIVDEMSKLKFS